MNLNISILSQRIHENYRFLPPDDCCPCIINFSWHCLKFQMITLDAMQTSLCEMPYIKEYLLYSLTLGHYIQIQKRCVTIYTTEPYRISEYDVPMDPSDLWQYSAIANVATS